MSLWQTLGFRPNSVTTTCPLATGTSVSGIYAIGVLVHIRICTGIPIYVHVRIGYNLWFTV